MTLDFSSRRLRLGTTWLFAGALLACSGIGPSKLQPKPDVSLVTIPIVRSNHDTQAEQTLIRDVYSQYTPSTRPPSIIDLASAELRAALSHGRLGADPLIDAQDYDSVPVVAVTSVGSGVHRADIEVFGEPRSIWWTFDMNGAVVDLGTSASDSLFERMRAPTAARVDWTESLCSDGEKRLVTCQLPRGREATVCSNDGEALLFRVGNRTQVELAMPGRGTAVAFAETPGRHRWGAARPGVRHEIDVRFDGDAWTGRYHYGDPSYPLSEPCTSVQHGPR